MAWGPHSQRYVALYVEVLRLLLLCLQVWHSAGRLDVPFRWGDLPSSETANLLHQLRKVSVGREHQPHEEAGLSRHTEENDHYKVQWAARTPDQPPLSCWDRLWFRYSSFPQRNSSPKFPRLHLPDEQLDWEVTEAKGRDRPRNRHRPLQQSISRLSATAPRWENLLLQFLSFFFNLLHRLLYVQLSDRRLQILMKIPCRYFPDIISFSVCLLIILTTGRNYLEFECALLLLVQWGNLCFWLEGAYKFRPRDHVVKVEATVDSISLLWLRIPTDSKCWRYFTPSSSKFLNKSRVHDLTPTNYSAGLEKNFNQWDPLINGEDDNLIPGTNVTVLQSAIWHRWSLLDDLTIWSVHWNQCTKRQYLLAS